jgi:hypothetical protein
MRLADPQNPYRTNWQVFADWRADWRSITIALILLTALFGWSWFSGTQPGPVEDSVSLRTEPFAHYVMARDGYYFALRPGCRYDFTYDPHFGRNHSSSPKSQRTRYVRKATLVDCPAAAGANLRLEGRPAPELSLGA